MVYMSNTECKQSWDILLMYLFICLFIYSL